MKREEAIKLLKQYQGYEPMSPDGETLKHSFDLTDETVDALLSALRPVSRREREIKKMKNNGETYLTPLTKEMKSSINIEIDKRVNELNTCDNTPYVALYKSVY